MSVRAALFDIALLLLRFAAVVVVKLVTCCDTVCVVNVVPCTVSDAEVVDTTGALLVVACVDDGAREETARTV